MPRRLHLTYLLLAGLLFSSTPVFTLAQEGEDTAHQGEQEDFLENHPDSENQYLEDSARELPEEDTLFFWGKEDPLSLTDLIEIQNRSVPDAVTREWKQDDAFWYANEKIEKKSSGLPFMEKILLALIGLLGSPSFVQLLWVLALVLLPTAVIWYLLKNKMNFWRSRKPAVINAPAGENDEQNIFETDLQRAASVAAAEGNYALAIRFDYLHLLKTFSENGLIRYTADTTNSQYLDQLKNKPPYSGFLFATRSYEYAWYGKMPVSRQEYDHIHNRLVSLYQNPDIPA